jgi:dihydropteroate synthase
MGILNVTPDSFHAASRKQTEAEIHLRVEEILSHGARIIDIGGCSSRPGAELPPADIERQRLRPALEILKEYPESIISVDTFRADIVRFAAEEYGAAIVNDISGGDLDPNMFQTVATLQLPYILMHNRGTPQQMQHQTAYANLLIDIRQVLSAKVRELQLLGLNDIIIDPGFGFGKTLEQNYELMACLSEFQIFDLPVLVGISRKSMIYNLLSLTPAESLNGTTALNVLALLNGASILRVHDVREAVEAIHIVSEYQKYEPIKPTITCGRKSE